jgi:hypothetical protein
MLKVYEFVPLTFDACTDDDDRLVVWIAATSEEHAQRALPNHRSCGEVEGVSPDDPSVDIRP